MGSVAEISAQQKCLWEIDNDISQIAGMQAMGDIDGATARLLREYLSKYEKILKE